MVRLVKLVPNMVELVLKNVSFTGNRMGKGKEKENMTPQDIYINILKVIGVSTSKILKLKLSSINLNIQG